MSKGRLDELDEEDFDGMVVSFPDRTELKAKHDQQVAKAHQVQKITSERQRGLFGAELQRRREGKAPQMEGITDQELEEHLREAGGKDLPEKARKENALRLVAKGIALIVRRLGGG